MISGKGWQALFRHEQEDKDGEKRITYDGEPIIAWGTWDSKPVGLVLGKGGRALVPADSFPNFERYTQGFEARLVLPANPGWWVEYWDDDDAEPQFMPVIAWSMEEDGWNVRAVVAGIEGQVEPDEKARFIYHPERTYQGASTSTERTSTSIDPPDL